MLDHQVQLQRDKQYLRWIFFLSDGNNPYKGVRWWIILRSGSQWSDVASVEKVLSSSEWTRALLGLANAPRPCFFPSITSINLSCGVLHPSAQQLRHRIIPLASTKEFLCKICFGVSGKLIAWELIVIVTLLSRNLLIVIWIYTCKDVDSVIKLSNYQHNIFIILAGAHPDEVVHCWLTDLRFQVRFGKPVLS